MIFLAHLVYAARRAAAEKAQQEKEAVSRFILVCHEIVCCLPLTPVSPAAQLSKMFAERQAKLDAERKAREQSEDRKKRDAESRSRDLMVLRNQIRLVRACARVLLRVMCSRSRRPC